MGVDNYPAPLRVDWFRWFNPPHTHPFFFPYHLVFLRRSVYLSSVGDSSIDCTTTPTDTPQPGFKLILPNRVVDDFGNEGNFTMIYNQGIEVWVNNRVFFWFSGYNDTYSFCDQSQIGWVHDMDGTNWQCLSVFRDSPSDPIPHVQPVDPSDDQPSGPVSPTEDTFDYEGQSLMFVDNIESISTRKALRSASNGAIPGQLAIYATSACANVPLVLFFDADVCFAPPAPFNKQYAAMMISVDSTTGAYIARLYKDAQCTADDATLVRGMGTQCNADATTESYFAVATPVSAECKATEFPSADCTGRVKSVYGLPASGVCSNYLFNTADRTGAETYSVDKSSSTYQQAAFLDEHCQGTSQVEKFNLNQCEKNPFSSESFYRKVTCAATRVAHDLRSSKLIVHSADLASAFPQRRVRSIPLLASNAGLTHPTKRIFRHDQSFLDAINEAQDMFEVGHYPEFEGKTIQELQRMRGGYVSGVSLREVFPEANHKPLTKPKLRASQIPKNFDWRNQNGVNYVSPVRNQGSCGSCYAYSSTGMMEARIRIRSQNKSQPILSTQDVVSCSQYAQGCEGGFPYLIAGKYGRDYGFTEEACYPYAGQDSKCQPNPQPDCQPQRWRTKEYYYIGGYYGQSTQQLMQEELMANGPISVSFEVYDDFMNYKGGVYTHKWTSHLKSGAYNPFKLVNHAVLCVGWGETDDGTPYWIVKNSWGPTWGENGYFRILRGSSETGGECGIESITVGAIPILH